MALNFLNRLLALAALAAFLIELIRYAVPSAFWTPTAAAVSGVLFPVFAADILIRLVASRDLRSHARRCWYQAIVFLPLAAPIAEIPGRETLEVMSRLSVAVMVLVMRTASGHKPVAALSQRPAQALVGGFVLTILTGTVLLMIPAASAAGVRTTFVDALFTATSATCVTGLSVCNISARFTVFGQIVILGLIQLGGLGIMTAAVSLVLLMGRSMNVKGQVALQGALDNESLAGARRLTLFILGMTFCFELAGAAVLTASWRSQFADLSSALYHATFHSISAFCNAGFSTFGDNLTPFREDVTTNVTIALLIVAGGLGFTVIRDLAATLRGRLKKTGGRRLRVQTRIVLRVSLLLIVLGAAGIYALDRGGELTSLSPRGKILAAVFQSVSARTAGFNTCNIGFLSAPSLFMLMILMFIGASPGSTGGGIKTTTAAVLWTVVLSRLRRREEAEICRRTIPLDVVLKAVSVFCISLVLVLFFAGVLLCTERQPLMDVLFETVSAFGTVGLSTGLTPKLTVAGRLLITLMMLIGRLGPLTMAYALATQKKQPNYTFAEERVMIG